MTTKTSSTSSTPAADIVAAVNKAHGKGAILEMGAEYDQVETFSTGSLALDLATRIGGYPRGRVVELYGPANTGKRTLALHAIAEVQRSTHGVCAFIDVEHALDVNYAKAIGVSVEKLLVSQPDTGEQALAITEMLVRSGAVSLIVIDSVNALTSRDTLEGVEHPEEGLQARMMSKALRNITATAYRTGATVIFINRLKMVPGKSASPLVGSAPGSNALKFYASMRIDVRNNGDLVTDGGVEVGLRVLCKVSKNKCAAPFTEARFPLLCGSGVDKVGELLDLAIKCGLVLQGSALAGKRDQARYVLQNDFELTVHLIDGVRAVFASGTVQP